MNIISSFINGRVKMDGSTRGGGHSEALRNYNLGRTLGIGTFGKVKIAEHKLTGHRVAIKIINCRQMKTMEMEEKGMVSYPVILHFSLIIFFMISKLNFNGAFDNIKTLSCYDN